MIRFVIDWEHQKTGDKKSVDYLYDGTGNQRGYSYAGWVRHCIAYGKREGYRYIAYHRKDKKNE